MEYVGTIADYYLEKSDNRAKSRSLMNKAATLSKIISFMDVSNGGGPFVDTPNFPYVAVIFNCHWLNIRERKCLKKQRIIKISQMNMN